MTVVLGIDAAWTPHEPSGVALVAKLTGRWRSLCVAPSYASFLDHAEGVPVDWIAGRFQGDNPDLGKLLPAAAKIAGKDVDVVSVDMPVSTVPFSGRRVADNAISRAFGDAVAQPIRRTRSVQAGLAKTSCPNWMPLAIHYRRQLITREPNIERWRCIPTPHYLPYLVEIIGSRTRFQSRGHIGLTRISQPELSALSMCLGKSKLP